MHVQQIKIYYKKNHCKSALIKRNLATLYRYSNFDLLFCFLSYVQRILQLMECDIDIILH